MNNQIEPKCFTAKTLSNLLKIVEQNDDLQFLGGCTTIDYLPQKYISLRNISELKKFEKWDRYFSFGPELTLAEIENKEEKNLPPLIFEAVKKIANRSVRNLATLAGNIFAETNGVKHTLYAPLLALDAKLEFVRAKSDIRTETHNVLLSKINEFDRKKWVLSKIRILNEEWAVSIFRKIGSSHLITEDSASYAFLADIQNSSLDSIRIAFAGKIVFRNYDLENQLAGVSLPLKEEIVCTTLVKADKIFNECCEMQKKTVSPFLKTQFINLLRFSLEQLM